MVRIRLNGEERAVANGLTIQGLLESLDLNPALVVVELNEEIIDRGAYAGVPVREGDRLELVHFVGGG